MQLLIKITFQTDEPRWKYVFQCIFTTKILTTGLPTLSKKGFIIEDMWTIISFIVVGIIRVGA